MYIAHQETAAIQLQPAPAPTKKPAEISSITGPRLLDDYRKPDRPTRLDEGANVLDPRAEELVWARSGARGAA